MPLFLMTIKLPRNPAHDPRNKVTAPCPAADRSPCTDATGEHHTYLVEAADRDTAVEHARQRYGHVTRVETTGYVGSAAALLDAWRRLPVPAATAVAMAAPELTEALAQMRRASA